MMKIKYSKADPESHASQEACELKFSPSRVDSKILSHASQEACELKYCIITMIINLTWSRLARGV